MSLIAYNYPELTTGDAETITNNFCGIPPVKSKVEYHIWINQKKLEFYSTSPFYKGDEHHQHLEGFKQLIACGKKLLNQLNEIEL